MNYLLSVIRAALKATTILVLTTSAQRSVSTGNAQRRRAEALEAASTLNIGDLLERENEAPSPNPDSCSMTVAKTCNSRSECSYKLNLPQVDIGSLVSDITRDRNDAATGLLAERLERVSSTCNDTSRKQKRYFETGRAMLYDLSAQLEKIETSFFQRLETLEGKLNQTNNSSRNMSGANTDKPTGSRTSTNNDQPAILSRVLQSQMRINKRMARLEESFITLFHNLEASLVTKIETITTMCGKRSIQEQTEQGKLFCLLSAACSSPNCSLQMSDVLR